MSHGDIREPTDVMRPVRRLDGRGVSSRVDSGNPDEVSHADTRELTDDEELAPPWTKRKRASPRRRLEGRGVSSRVDSGNSDAVSHADTRELTDDEELAPPWKKRKRALPRQAGTTKYVIELVREKYGDDWEIWRNEKVIGFYGDVRDGDIMS